MGELAELLEVTRAAVAVGAELLATDAPGTVRAKTDRDYVTDLDLRIQEEIRRFLVDAAGDGIDFLGEEDDDAADTGARYRWVLDPIDGTANFIHGLPMCAVSLALTCDGAPVVGVVGAPLLGLEYYGAAEAGAFVASHEGQVQRLCASTAPTLSAAVVSIGDYATGPGADVRNRERLAVTAALAARAERVRMIGSAALDLAWVAQGRIDACILLSNKPWDTAAGALLAREAGAQVLDSDGTDYDPAGSAHVVAAGRRISPDLRALITESVTASA